MDIEVRCPGAGPYVRVSTSAIRDRRLSFRARGLYAFLAGLPDDVEPTPRWLADQGPDGVDSVRSALAELEFHGYIEPVGLGALRPSIPLKLRYQTLRRDGYACRYCGARAPRFVLVADHVLPVARGGLTVLENLVTACEPCNIGKSAAVPENWLLEELQRTTQAWLANIDHDLDASIENEAKLHQPIKRGHLVVRVRKNHLIPAEHG